MPNFKNREVGEEAIRLVALDLDGTLLTSDKEISPRTQEAISLLRRRGVEFVIATGRIFPSALPYALEIGQRLPMTCINGTMVRDVLTREVLYHNPLKNGVAVQVLEVLEGMPVYTILFDGDAFVMREVPPFLVTYFKKTRVDVKIVSDLKSGASPELSQIVLAGRDQDVSRVRDHIVSADHHRLEVFFYPSSSMEEISYLEIRNGGDTKGSGLRMIKERLSLKDRHVMAIGDYDNDLSLFEEADLRVAMRNASPRLKEAAHYVTERTNDQDGVVEALGRAFPDSI